MSEQEEKKEEGIDIERAARFFGALKDYFRQNPKGLTVVLHNISVNLVDTINGNGEFREDLGYIAGQLEVVSDLIWNHDDNEVIQQALTSPSNLEDIMNALALLATAYSKLTSNTDIILGDIENIIRDAATTLYRIIEYIITDVGNDP